MENPYSVSEHQTSGDFQSLGPKFDSQLRVMQIIVGTILVFDFSILYVGTRGYDWGSQLPTEWTGVAALTAVVATALQFFVIWSLNRIQFNKRRCLSRDNWDNEAEIAGWCRSYTVQWLARYIILEVALLLNLSALLIAKCGLSLYPIVLLILLMVLNFPTHTRVDLWLRQRMNPA